MRTKAMFGVLLLALPLSVCAAPNDSMLLTGQSVRTENGKTIFAGSVSAIFKDGTAGMNVSADEIVLDQQGGKNLLKCSGDVVIRPAGRTIKGKDCTIELGDGHYQNIYILNPNGIVLSSTAVVNTGGFYASTMFPNSGENQSDNNTSDFKKWQPNTASGPMPKFDTPPATLLPRR